MSEKIIVLQDGSIFNLRNIIKIVFIKDTSPEKTDGLGRLYIQDISEEYTEIYRGTEAECQSALQRLSIMLKDYDSVVRLDCLWD